MLISFLILLAAHWFGDFFLQTHWQASNKSKDLTALGRHVFVYTSFVTFVAAFVFGVNLALGKFFFANFFLHLVTDAVTSRITSKLFMAQFETIAVGTEPRLAMKRNFNPHNFFVVIGYDQLLHQAALAGTMWWYLFDGKS